MARSLAAALGSLAVAIVCLRGVVQGELAGAIAMEALLMLVLYAMVGGLAGRILDGLLRDSLERIFRARVDWYRQGLIDVGYPIEENPGEG